MKIREVWTYEGMDVWTWFKKRNVHTPTRPNVHTQKQGCPRDASSPVFNHGTLGGQFTTVCTVPAPLAGVA